jgi:hypothetical protein
MKGLVFNVLEEVVIQERGAEAWDDLPDSAGLDGDYISLGSYDDAEFMALVEAASARLTMPSQDVLRWFGQHAIKPLAKRYRASSHGTRTREPFLTLNDIIHPEVGKDYLGADVPEFRFEKAGDDTLIMEYVSARRMCGFARGMLEGAAALFGEAVRVENPSACTTVR